MLAVGRLCGLSDTLHGQASDPTLLDATVSTISSASQPNLVVAAMYLLYAAVRSSAEVAQVAVEQNATAALCERLEDSDVTTKQAAVWCLAAIASHEASLASAVIDAGALPMLLLCLKERSLPLRRLTLSCLGSIAKHEQSLAELVAKEGACTAALGCLTLKDMLLRRQACRMLACAVQHHSGACEWVPTKEREPIIETLRIADPQTVAFAATLVQQLAKHSNSVASSFYELGALPLLVASIGSGEASPAPAAAALGHLCDASSDAAIEAVKLGAIEAIHPLLAAHAPIPICCVLSCALGAMSSSDESVAKKVDGSGCIELLAEATLLSGRKHGEAAREVLRKGFGKLLSKSNAYGALVYLLERLPFSGAFCEPLILASLLKAISRVLGMKGAWRLDFMQRGALTVAQQAGNIKGSQELKDALKQLNAVYPSQMVAATAPDYEKKLLDKIV
mmetsp:Transcript_41540/g.109578  ORF Transcript_41540/g.109578 Transcript_41540/m.109578 type:complete len:451 (-) Transcript_41540:319-1671(-)